MTTQKWSDERTAQLVSVVGSETPVSAETVNAAAVELETSPRSISSKLRKLGYEVASLAKVTVAKWSADQAATLASVLNSNPNVYSYHDLSDNFFEGEFSAKQIQGKVLSMELTGLIKPAEKTEPVRTYTKDEEDMFLSLVETGNFVEDIAAKLNKSVNSVRGKALSLLRAGEISKIPAQRESHAKDTVDAFEALGASVATMTVAEIAASTNKTERGIRTILTRRGIKCADYDGEAKRAKADEKVAA